MKTLLLILTMVMGISTYAQDPQTNAPKVIYPLMDEFIKEGFDRNYRHHTRILSAIDYIKVEDLSRIDPRIFHIDWGSTDTFLLYAYYDNSLGEWKFLLGFNYVWANNYYVLRRMYFKAMGMVNRLQECHEDCKHIMGGRKLMDPILVFYDAVPEQWEDELDIFYHSLKK